MNAQTAEHMWVSQHTPDEYEVFYRTATVHTWIQALFQVGWKGLEAAEKVAKQQSGIYAERLYKVVYKGTIISMFAEGKKIWGN